MDDSLNPEREMERLSGMRDQIQRLREQLQRLKEKESCVGVAETKASGGFGEDSKNDR